MDKVNGKSKFQVIWGTALLIAGIGVFFRIPQVMPEIEKIDQFSSAMFFIRLCFYLMGILLIGGGSKKIYQYFSKVSQRVISNKNTGVKGV
jgi:hypothetical protein